MEKTPGRIGTRQQLGHWWESSGRTILPFANKKKGLHQDADPKVFVSPRQERRSNFISNAATERFGQKMIASAKPDITCPLSRSQVSLLQKINEARYAEKNCYRCGEN